MRMRDLPKFSLSASHLPLPHTRAEGLGLGRMALLGLQRSGSPLFSFSFLN